MKTHATVNATLTFTNEKGEKDYIVIFRDEAHERALSMRFCFRVCIHRQHHPYVGAAIWAAV